VELIYLVKVYQGHSYLFYFQVVILLCLCNFVALVLCRLFGWASNEYELLFLWWKTIKNWRRGVWHGLYSVLGWA